MEGAELDLFEGGIAHATATASGEALDAALTDLGWHDALAADRRAAVSVLFERQGAANATSSALNWLLADALGAAGRGAVTVVLPAFGLPEPPGRLAGGRCALSGLATGAPADRVLVVATAGDRPAALTLPARDLEVRPVHGIDPALGVAEVSGEVRAPDRVTETVDWEGAVGAGHLALGHELVGVARAMLALARAHAVERVQFGRPIASFQAVRHRLAEALVAVEGADGLLAAAWEDPSPVTAAMAKAVAGRSARTVARHAQQVLAGMGFTAEHPLHHHVRRTVVLDQLLGAGALLTRRLGADVLGTGALPPPLPL